MRQVDVVHANLSKAPDPLNQIILLSKLDSMMFSINILAIIDTYLSNRRKYVQVRDHISKSSLASEVL